MSDIKAIIFDLDDTLLWDEKSVEEAFRATCQVASKQHVIDPEELEQAVRKEAKQLYATYESFPFTKNIGINPFEGLWARFNDTDHEGFKQLKSIVKEYRKNSWTLGLKALGIEDAALGEKLGELFAYERRNRPIVYEETFEALEQLKGKYTLMMLTNGSPELQQEKLDAVPQLAPYFDHILVSGAFGQGKPTKALFEHALELLKVQAHQAIMVGDKLTTDILGASRTGIPSVWINRQQRERSEEIIPDYEITNLLEVEEIANSLKKVEQ